MIRVGSKVREKKTGQLRVVSWIGGLGNYYGFVDSSGRYYEMSVDLFDSV